MRWTFLTTWCCAIFWLFFSDSAWGWPRLVLDDDHLVAEAELIVVARFMEGSIQLVPHKRKPNAGASHHYHATLIVSEVLKGKLGSTKLPITIHYGLDPTILGKFIEGSNTKLGPLSVVQTDKIALWDTGGVFHPVASDIRENHVWMLKTRQVDIDDESIKALGIQEPQEIAPVTILPYFRAMLSKQRGSALKKLATEKSVVGNHARDFIGQLDLRLAAKDASPSTRLAKALPYFLDTTYGQSRQSARMLIIDCRAEAAKSLIHNYHAGVSAELQHDIISMCGSISCPEAEAFLVKILQDEEAFWSLQIIQGKDYLEPPPGTPSNRDDSWDSYRKCESAIYGFSSIGNTTEALQIAKTMLRRWGQPPNHSFPQLCSRTVESIATRLTKKTGEH